MPWKPLDPVPLDHARAAAGEGADAFPASGAEILLGPLSAVIIAPAVDDLTASGVWDGRTFRLVGPVPRLTSSRFHAYGSESRPIHLFVRLPEGGLYLGTLSHASSTWTRDPEVLRQGDLWLDSPLSRDVLDRVRPPAAPSSLPGLDWLDHLPADPVEALRLFLRTWHPAPAAEPEEPPPAIPVPPALAEFYRLTRGRPHARGVQNFIRPPGELGLRADGLLAFGHENQGYFEWVLDPGQDEPTVWTIDDYQERHPERERLTGFLLQFSLYEAAVDAPYRAWTGPLPTPVAEELTTRLRRVPLKTWMWPLYRISFYVAPGLIATVETDEEQEECDISLGAAHRSVLRPLAGLDIDWTAFDG